jgi:hypothetical protein
VQPVRDEVQPALLLGLGPQRPAAVTRPPTAALPAVSSGRRFVERPRGTAVSYEESQTGTGGRTRQARTKALALQHDYKRADDVLDQAYEPAPGGGHRWRTEQQRVQYQLVVALVHNFLGQIQLSSADYGRAAQLFTAALDAARSTPDRFTILISPYDLALSSQARGDLDAAAGLLRQGLSLAAEVGDKPAAAYYLEALAAIARQQDDPHRAARLLAAAGAQLQAGGSGRLHAFAPRARMSTASRLSCAPRMRDAAYEQAAAHGRSLRAHLPYSRSCRTHKKTRNGGKPRVRPRPVPSANQRRGPGGA